MKATRVEAIDMAERQIDMLEDALNEDYDSEGKPLHSQDFIDRANHSRDVWKVIIEALCQPKPQDGTWERLYGGDYWCSTCHATFMPENSVNTWKYCPYCGSKNIFKG